MLRRNSYVEYYGPMDQNYRDRPEFYRIHLGMTQYIVDHATANLPNRSLH